MSDLRARSSGRFRSSGRSRPTGVASLLHPAGVLALLVACGGDGEPAGPPNDDPPPETPASVQGQVTHAEAGVGSVVVHLRSGPGADREMTTENDGAFEFEDVEPGSWELEIVPPEYFQLAQGEEAVRSIDLGEGESFDLEVGLAPLEELEVLEIEATAGLSFSPAVATVPPGTVVRWINTSTVLHTVTPDEHSEWSEGVISSQGDIFEAAVNNPGEFDYFCVPHLGDGMVGEIRVEP